MAMFPASPAVASQPVPDRLVAPPQAGAAAAGSAPPVIDGRLLAIGDRKGVIRIIDPQTGSEKVTLMGHLRDIASLSFSPDGQTLVSGAADGTAKVWRVADGREMTTIKAHGNAVSSVAYSQDGRTIATGGADRKIMLWDTPAVVGDK